MSNDITEQNYQELLLNMNNINRRLEQLGEKDPLDTVRKRNAELFGKNPDGYASPEVIKQIKYLAAGNATDTTRAGTGVQTLLPTIWSPNIIRDAAAERNFEPWAYVDKTLVKGGGTTVNIPIETNASSMTNNATEADATTYTEEDSLAGKDFTPTVRRYGVGISYETARQSAINRLMQAKRQLTTYGTDVIDAAIGTACANTGDNAANMLYGGNAAGVEDLATGDIITVDLEVNAFGEIKGNKWKNERGTPRQFAFFIGTEQETVFLKDSQFVNASEYGSDRIVTTGEIGEYLGAKTVVSNNIPTKDLSAADFTEGQNWGAAGNVCIALKGQTSVGLAYSEFPKITYWFDNHENVHRFYYYTMFKSLYLQGDSMCLVKVTNA